ncbi:MAG TPA: hypothetical protein VF044_07445 [Actinomycetota bacterium]|jgi:uncharacterized membrane protein HdeD (DUF308 family)
MSKIYGSSGRRSDPLSNVGLLVGIVGAALGALLWYYHFQPNSDLLGSYSLQVAEGQLHDQMSVLAAVFGVMAVISGIGASLGGRGRGSSVAALVLGVVALTYPVLTYLNVFTTVVPRPLG